MPSGGPYCSHRYAAALGAHNVAESGRHRAMPAWGLLGSRTAEAQPPVYRQASPSRNDAGDMPQRKRTSAMVAGDVEAAAIASMLGKAVRIERRRRQLTQRGLGRRVQLSQARISEIERGLGTALPLASWVAIGIAVGTPLAVRLSRPIDAGMPADAGHLAIQEDLLRLARATGRTATFELATRPADPSRSVDVGIRDDRHRVLVLEEAWNTFGDIGAARRSTARKVAEAEALAVAIGNGAPYRVASVWVIRATAANRELVRRYPEVFASACPGSSRAWLDALMTGGAPPVGQGLVWSDPASGRLTAWRRRGAMG